MDLFQALAPCQEGGGGAAAPGGDQEGGGGAGQAQAGGGGDRGGEEDQQEDPGDRGVHRGAGLAAREGEDRAHEEENQKSDKQNLPSCVRGGHRGE